MQTCLSIRSRRTYAVTCQLCTGPRRPLSTAYCLLCEGPELMQALPDVDEDVGHLDQFPGHVGGERDHLHAHAAALDQFDQAREIAVTGDQDHHVKPLRHRDDVDGELDVKVAFRRAVRE